MQATLLKCMLKAADFIPWSGQDSPKHVIILPNSRWFWACANVFCMVSRKAVLLRGVENTPCLRLVRPKLVTGAS